MRRLGIVLAALSLAACGAERTETYPAPVSDVFAKLSSGG